MQSVCCVLVCGQAVVSVNHVAWATVSDRGHLQKETTHRIRNRNGPRWTACAAAWGYPLGNGGGGRGAKILFRSPCWAIMRQYHPTMCPYRAALFVPRPHHARTTPHRRDQASVLHGGCELKGHLCDLGTQALVSCGIAQSTRRRYGRGRQPKQPEHHAAAARLTHLAATIRTHAS